MQWQYTNKRLYFGTQSSNGEIRFTTDNGAERVIFDENGNVGIGTLTPTERLNVSGNVLISANLTATTISATTYLNLPDNVTGNYLPLSGGTVTGNTIFTSGLTANTISADTLTVTNNINSTSRSLYDSIGLDSISWQNRYLFATDVTPTIDWENCLLAGLGGSSSFDWNQRLMYDTGPNLVIDWQNLILYDAATNVVLDWQNKIMTGMTNIQSSTISATTYQNLPNSLTGLYLPTSGGTVTGNTVFTQNISVTGGTGINLFSGNTSTDLLRVTQTGSGNAFVVEDDTNPDSSPFVITSDGKVGIGLTTPTQRLLVRENTSGETRIDVSNQSTASGVSTSAYFLAGTTGNRYMSMGNYGPNATGTYIGLNKSGIGVFEAGVDTTAMIFNAANPSGAPIVFGQVSTERMRISSTGNVGIGTTSPRQKLDVIGNTIISSGLTAQTAVFSSSSQSVLTVIGSGNSTTSPLFSVQGSSGELFSVSDSLVGSLFSVNDISGLPIMEVFSDNTTLWGSYQAPSLNTTVKTSAGTGSTTVYTIPQSAYTGAFFEYTVSSTSGARAGSIMSIFSGSSVQYTETTTNDIGSTTGLTFSVSANSTNAVLLASGVTAGWTIKTIVRSI
jgi:hypothetical protein